MGRQMVGNPGHLEKSAGRSGIPYAVCLTFLLLFFSFMAGCGKENGMDKLNGVEPMNGSDTMNGAEPMNGSDTTNGVDAMNGADAVNGADTKATDVSLEMAAIRLNPAERHQEMEGFGTSGCWWSQDVGTWDVSVRDQVSDWLFDKEKGIGLTQYRFNAGGGGLNEARDPWRRVETFETAPGVYDWSKDAGSVDMMRRAVARGVKDVLIFANSPPGRMLKNGRTTGDDKGDPNLLPGMEDEFARYLVDIADHFKSEGIPVGYISPVNEPQWNWKLENGQEGCHYEPEGVVEVGRALMKELKARNSDIRASLIDSGKMWDARYTVDLYGKLAKDPDFAGQLPHFSVHAYWTNEEDKRMLAAAIRQSGVKLPLWQSEWCQMEGGTDFGMGPALVLARCVQEDLTILDCTAWQTWIAVTCYDYKDGLVHVDKASRSATDMKRLWALGNWSRFVRPGYVRIAAESPDKNLLVSAWLSQESDEVVLVAVNEGTEAITAEVAGMRECAGLSADPVMTAWETSETFNLTKVSEGPAGAYGFPARSVTTLVLR